MTTEASISAVEDLLSSYRSQADAAQPGEGQIHLRTITEALQSALRALEHQRAREFRRSELPPQAGHTWDDADDAILLIQYQTGMTIADLATYYQRTESAVERRLHKLAFTGTP